MIRKFLILCLLGAVSSGLSGCRIFSNLDKLSKDSTNLKSFDAQVSTQQLTIIVSGGTADQRQNIGAAFKDELEDGNLFESVILKPIGGNDPVMTPAQKQRYLADNRLGNPGDSQFNGALRVDAAQHRPGFNQLFVNISRRIGTEFGNMVSDSEGWIVRYEATSKLINDAGESVLSGPIVGVAYDDNTELIDLDPFKRREIELAAQQDLAVKIGDWLEAEVEKKVVAELEEIPVLKLAPGIGPIDLAIVSIDLKKAHPKVRVAQVESDLRTALELAGPEIKVLGATRVERLIETQNLPPITGLNIPEEVQRWLVRELPSRYVLLVQVESTGNIMTIESAFYEVSELERKLLFETRHETRGLAAIRFGSIGLVQKLLTQLSEYKFKSLDSDKN